MTSGKKPLGQRQSILNSIRLDRESRKRVCGYKSGAEETLDSLESGRAELNNYAGLFLAAAAMTPAFSHGRLGRSAAGLSRFSMRS